MSEFKTTVEKLKNFSDLRREFPGVYDAFNLEERRVVFEDSVYIDLIRDCVDSPTKGAHTVSMIIGKNSGTGHLASVCERNDIPKWLIEAEIINVANAIAGLDNSVSAYLVK